MRILLVENDDAIATLVCRAFEQRGLAVERASTVDQIRFREHREGYRWRMNATVLWVIAAILVVVGIVQLLQGQLIFGIVLIIAGCLVGPGGYSIFRRRA
jgi:Flp pilus assembly protein TadB